MQFFIDTANVAEIRRAASLGVLDGVTTNPSLVAKEGKDFHTVLREICSLVNGPISAEVTALDRDTMLEQGLVLLGVTNELLQGVVGAIIIVSVIVNVYLKRQDR